MTFINLIPHGNLTPDQGFVFFIGLFLFSLVGYGIYLTWGAGKNDLRDPIDEHAKMHELGIAHGHEGKALWIKEKGKNIKHSHPPDLLG